MVLLIFYIIFSYIFMGGMMTWSNGKLKNLAFYLAPFSLPFLLGGYCQKNLS